MINYFLNHIKRIVLISTIINNLFLIRISHKNQMGPLIKTDKLVTELNSLVLRGVENILGDFMVEHELYKKTHDAVMSLPCVVNEISKVKKQQKEKEKGRDAAHDSPQQELKTINLDLDYKSSTYSFDNVYLCDDDNDNENCEQLYRDDEVVSLTSDRHVQTENDYVKEKENDKYEKLLTMIETLNSDVSYLCQEVIKLRETNDKKNKRAIIDLTEDDEEMENTEILPAFEEKKIKKEKRLKQEENIIFEIIEDEDEADEKIKTVVTASASCDVVNDTVANHHAEDEQEEGVEEEEEGVEEEEEGAEEEEEGVEEEEEGVEEEEEGVDEEQEEDVEEEQEVVEEEEEVVEEEEEVAEEEGDETEIETEDGTQEEEEEEEEPDDDDNAEYDLVETEINGITYCTCEETGKIYELVDDEVGKKVGYYRKDGTPFFYKK